MEETDGTGGGEKDNGCSEQKRAERPLEATCLPAIGEAG
jgi:hypothetical protein